MIGDDHDRRARDVHARRAPAIAREAHYVRAYQLSLVSLF